MVSTNEFKTGLTVTIDNDPWQVVEFQHVKPGKGAAFVRAKMRNLSTGAVVERTFNAGERLPKANIERRIMQYLYESDGNFVFMDNDTYEQTELSKEQIGNGINFLKENMDVKVISYQNRILGVELPNTVELVVVKTEPGIRGDTATGGSKPATMDTGYIVKVPLFINEGDHLLIDTRSGDYIQRVQTNRYNEILEKRGAQGVLCGMGAEFVAQVFEHIHEESVRQQIEIINK